MRRIMSVMTRLPAVVLSLFFSLSAFAQQADLRAAITSAPESIRAGDEVVFTAEVENLGPDPAESTRVGLNYGPTICHDNVIGTLQPGEKRAFTCKGPTPPSPPYYAFIPQVHANSSTDDPRPVNNSDSRLVRLITPPDLFIFTNTQDLRVPGLPFTTTIRYGNRATVAANDAVVTITSPTPITRAPESCIVTGTRAVCAFGRIEQGYVDVDIETIAPETSATPIGIVLEIATSEGENEPADNRYVTDRNATYTTFFVTNTTDHESGSLRAAIEAANASCRDPQLHCLIGFRIPGQAVAQQTIALEGPLPYVMAYNMIVDGGTQRSFFGNSVAVRGDALAAGDGLLVSTSCDAVVRDLTIEGFPGFGIGAFQLEPCQNNPFALRRIEGNVLRRNGRGLWIDRPMMTVTKNEIRDQQRAGIYIARGQTYVFENTIANNGASGIFAGALASGTDIRRNTISGNAHFGVGIDRVALNVSVNENLIFGNSERPIDYGLDGLTTIEPVAPPQITNVRDDGGETVIEATSTAGGTFAAIIEIYASDTPHPRGFAEARQFIGTMERDNVARVWRLRARADLRGKWISATATRVVYTGWARAPRPDGDTGYGYFTTTSEFSPPIQVK